MTSGAWPSGGVAKAGVVLEVLPGLRPGPASPVCSAHGGSSSLNHQ